VGQWLRQGKIKKSERHLLAEVCGVDVRTLWNWEKQTPKKLGRPGHSATVRLRVLFRVGREMRRIGWESGWRDVWKELQYLSTSLVQWGVQAFKRRRRARLNERRKMQQVRTEVLKKGAVLCQDSTHVGRVQGQACQAEVIKDRATLKTLALAVGKPLDGKGVCRLLDAIRSRSGLPLVWMTDNGKIYRDILVQKYLKKYQVLHMLNRIYTAQDNGAIEISGRELKTEAILGKGVKLQDHAEAMHRLLLACCKLDGHRPRGSKGYKTAAELERTMPRWYSSVKRAVFYRTACSAIKRAVLDTMTPRQQRTAMREAIFQTLEKFDLIRRTRGGLSRLAC